MDSEDRDIAESIRKHGWHAISVTDRNPPFVYTCGLMVTFAHPELIIFGLNPKVAYSILAVVVEDLRSGKMFSEPGEYRGVVEEDWPILVRQVHPSQHERYLGYAMAQCRLVGRV